MAPHHEFPEVGAGSKSSGNPDYMVRNEQMDPRIYVSFIDQPACVCAFRYCRPSDRNIYGKFSDDQSGKS